MFFVILAAWIAFGLFFAGSRLMLPGSLTAVDDSSENEPQ